MDDAALKIEDLHTYFFTKQGVVKAVNGVGLTLTRGRMLGLVGESGSGKSVTALSVLQLVPRPGKIVQGKILFNGSNLLDMSELKLRDIRGKDISIVFQDPTMSLNPTLTVGFQIEEIFRAHTQISRKEARDSAIELFRHVGLGDAESVFGRYTFELSGGMAQRVMIAMALALNPKILIADELTSNLDVTLQAQVLEYLKEMRSMYQSSIILITHDLGVVARMADDVAVMYAGSIVETADSKTLFKHPAHPYTWGLFQSLPRLDEPDRALLPMKGTPPSMIDLPNQCPFLPRCSKATIDCRLSPKPELTEIAPGHHVACYNAIHNGD